MFAMLDDSDDEQPVAVQKKKETKKAATAKPSSSVSKSNGGSGNGSGTGKGRNGGRSNPNNDRNTKGGRGPRAARDGKRTYDRRSGTGRGKEIKKGGGGARNWGSDKNEAKKMEGNVNDNNANSENDADVPPDTNTNTTPEPEPIVEEVDNSISLDEYLASKKEVTLFGSSKGEKTVENEFEGKKSHVIEQGEFLKLGSGKSLRKKADKKEVEKLDVKFRFKRTDGGGDRDDRPRRSGRDGGDRGGRGGGRGKNDRRGGGGRRGGGRGGGRGASFALDSNSFPSL